jgi:hypothetical protein
MVLHMNTAQVLISKLIKQDHFYFFTVIQWEIYLEKVPQGGSMLSAFTNRVGSAKCTTTISYSFLVSTSTRYAQHHVFFKFQSTHYYFLILYGFLRHKLQHRNRKERWGWLVKICKEVYVLTITKKLWWIKSWNKNIKLPDNLAI